MKKLRLWRRRNDRLVLFESEVPDEEGEGNDIKDEDDVNLWATDLY